MALSVSPTDTNKLKHLLIACTAGNLLFVRRWYDLERLQGFGLDYYRESPQTPDLFIATLLASFLVTCVFYFGWKWTTYGDPWRKRTGLAIFAFVLVFPLESIRRYWNLENGRMDLLANLALVALEIVLATAGIMALRGDFRIARSAEKALLVLSLLVPVLVFDFSMGLVNREREDAFEKQTSLPMFSARPPHAPRVVWVVFDEMDQRLAFDVRPATIDLPELDRVRAEAVVADHATPTADWTVIALPSLISGRIYGKAEMINSRTLHVTPEGDSQPLNWREQPNIFKQARAMGVNAEIIGWHHPYCRVLGDQMPGCFTMPSGHPTNALLRETLAAEDGVWQTTHYLFRLQWENLRDLFRRDRDSVSENLKDLYLQRRQQKQYFEIRDRAYRAAVDPRLGMLLLHLPLPHPYAFYNRRERSFNLQSGLDYFDNLALADRTIGELRLALEQARMWPDTTLLITSDHGIRPDNWEGRLGWTDELERLTGVVHGKTVPFILKLAGEHEPVQFSKPFSNVVSSRLVLAVLTGKVATPAQAVAWLDAVAAEPSTSSSEKATAVAHQVARVPAAGGIVQ
jgi:hypothetical protein